MDPTEDLSARILLKQILVTEPPRTPVTLSEARGESSSGVRRSSRRSHKDGDAQTPQSILRRGMKQKIRESITRKSLPATKRRTASVVLRKTQTPASFRLSDGDTPRHLLRNILQIEPAKSPVVHEKGPSEEQDLPSAEKTATRTHPSIELSGLDLPDVTISHAASTAKGLSRKRPRRSLNVTAFEKRLKAGDDTEEEAGNSTADHSSLSLSSSDSLSLKTPFADVRTEKKDLKRRVSNRRKITKEEFGAAVNRREMGVVSSHAQVQRDLSETADSDGFTLGLTKLGEPDITTDIVSCKTALYDLPDATTSNFSIVATQDKPTIMASQLQREMQEMEEEEMEQRKVETEKSVFVFPREEEAAAEPENDECVSEAQLQEDVDESESQTNEAHDQQENAAVTSTCEEEDGAGSQIADTDDRTESEEVEAQTGEEGAADSPSEDAAEAHDQMEGEQVARESPAEDEEGSAASQTNFQSEDFEAVVQSDKQSDSQTEEQEEGSAADSQSEDAEAGSRSDEEEVALGSEGKEDEDEEEEEDAAESQSEDEAAGSPYVDAEAESRSERDELAAESQSEDDRRVEGEEEPASEVDHDLEHISRQARRSEFVQVLPMTEGEEGSAWTTAAGLSDSRLKAHTSLDLNTSLEVRSQEPNQSGKTGRSESPMEEREDDSCPEDDPEAGEENTRHLLQATQDIRVSSQGDLSPEGIPAQDAGDNEEWEEEEDDDIDEEELPAKTPAFVKQKRTFFLPDSQASPSVLRNIQAGSSTEAAAKPKPVKERLRRPSMKKTVLPKAYLMSVFKHFAKTNVSADVFPILNETMDKFFGRLADDLETYATHAKRKTIDVEDVKLLLMRQGYVNDKMPVEVLIEKYLRMEQRKLLIPIATSGNIVIPKKRR